MTIVLCGAVRSPIGGFLGSLSDIPTVELGAICAQESIRRAKVPLDQIDEVILGHVLSASHGQNPARQVSIKAGLSNSVPATQTSVLCASGMRAVVDACRAIGAGDAKIILAGGMESMSRAAHGASIRKQTKKLGPVKIDADLAEKGIRLADTMMSDGLMCALTNQHMGNTAENIAARFNITREAQDAYAAESQRRAAEAIKAGHFDNEIVKVEWEGKSIERDECPKECAPSEYSSLPPVFTKTGSVTRFNACGLNDGAATMIVADQSKAAELGLVAEAEVIGTAHVGCDPEVMGLGPVYAVKALLQKIKLTTDQIDLFELNEAFAAQSLACVNELGLDASKVNVNGGSIALGHPIGASGARILATLINALRQREKKNGIAALCVGGGMGIAVAIRLV